MKKKSYYANGQRVAMRDGGTVYFLLPDHLGSTAVTADGSGDRTAELWYKPWGENRNAYGTTPTSYRFTGQREDATIGLYFYHARYYDPMLGRFISPDTIVPSPGDPQSLNRYSYTRNNPVRYTDPSGHYVAQANEANPCPGVIGGCRTVVNGGWNPDPPVVQIAPEAKEAAFDLLTAIDPTNLPEIRYDDAGKIDIDATISTLSMIPALHACALTVQGACAVGIQGSGFMPGMGGRSSTDIWVTASGEIVITGSGGGGAYVSPNLVGGETGIGVTVLPSARAQDLNGWSVQVGGSVIVVGGIASELVFLQADSGSTIVGVSTSYGTGGGVEGHASFTYTGYLYQGVYVPR